MEVNFSPSIQKILTEEADRIGITQEDLVKFLIDAHFTGGSVVFPTQKLHEGTSGQNIMDELLKMADISLSQMFLSGALKCPNCKMPLTIESIESGECPSCHNKL